MYTEPSLWLLNCIKKLFSLMSFICWLNCQRIIRSCLFCLPDIFNFSANSRVNPRAKPVGRFDARIECCTRHMLRLCVAAARVSQWRLCSSPWRAQVGTPLEEQPDRPKGSLKVVALFRDFLCHSLSMYLPHCLLRYIKKKTLSYFGASGILLLTAGSVDLSN